MSRMTTSDILRTEHAALRLRILSGCWGPDLDRYIAQYVDPTRQAAWGVPNRGVNFLRSVVEQLSVIYDESPTISHPDLDDTSALHPVFGLSQTHEDYVLACRESAVRVSWVQPSHLNDGGLSVRLVTPDNLVVESASWADGAPTKISELRSRYNPELNQTARYWDVWDVSDPSNPSFRVVSDSSNNPVDWTKTFAPEMETYPYVDSQGRPYLPWVLYHARDTGRTWDPYTWDELVWGTLAVGLYYTMFSHGLKDASWVQKYAINAELMGARTEGDLASSRSQISTDPASILLFAGTSDQTATLGSFPLPQAPQDLIAAIKTYQQTILESLNLGKFDATQVSTSSGVAIQIRRDLIREISRGFMPQFRRGDEQLLSVAAKIYNQYSGAASLPEEGYQVQYRGIPPSNEEINQQLDRDLALLDRGLMSKVDIMMTLIPGLTRDDAIDRLLLIQRENELLAVSADTTPQDGAVNV